MRLTRRLLEEIRRTGPITFASFMEAALYDPEEGFYADPPVGAEGHFVTSPHVSPAFGDLVARQVAQCWDLLGRPPALDVVELGAGDGTLARQILRAVAAVPGLAGAIRYVGVERAEGARRALAEAGVEAASALPERVDGVILANELLDNVPFHRLRERDGRVVEVLVGANGTRLVEVEGEPTAEAMKALAGPPLRPGEERPVAPAVGDLVRTVAASLDRGYAFLIDYGFTRAERAAPVHAYRDHRVLANVLDEPGSRDVTVAVDLGAVAGAARDAGLQVWGPVSQHDALLALGYRTWSSGVRARQAEAEERGDWREANRLFGERSRASILIDQDELGGLRLLALGTGGLDPPAAVLGDPERGC
ncbi:MAG TPA: SAM-dependent methyltransferase [Actinomycetota bacterium]